MIQARSLETSHQTSFSNGSHSATADVPVEKGGAGGGFGPHELLEAAFATCLTMTVRMYAAEHGFPLDGVGCEVRIDRTVPGSVALDYFLTLDGPLSDEQRARLRSAAGRCPVAKTLGGVIALRPLERAE